MSMVTLENDEQILVQMRRHWITFVRDAAGVLAIGIALLLLLGLMNLPYFASSNDTRFLTILAYAEVLWILILWGAFAVLWTKYYLDLWVVTNRRVISVEQSRLFDRVITSWQFETIHSVSFETKNPLQSFFDYGLVLFKTKDGAQAVRIEGVPRPDLVSNTILHQLEKYRGLEEATKKQEVLLHTVSHEVKAHLAKNEAVLSLIAAGDFGSVPEKVKSIASTALADTREGVGMVMNILSSSDFKSGTMNFSFKPFDLARAVEGVATELKAAIEQKGLLIRCSIPQAALIVSGDEQKIQSHVIRNLIENAIHYTPKGSIEVILQKIENALLLSVKDTGVGVSAEDMARLFTEGGKGVNASVVNPSSTGFGLFIAKQVVEAHGGVIWAKSEGHNKGSTFYVCFPAAPGSPQSTNTV